MLGPSDSPQRLQAGEHRAGPELGVVEFLSRLGLAGTALDETPVDFGLAVGGEVAAEGLADEIGAAAMLAGRARIELREELIAELDQRLRSRHSDMVAD
jgi:hypothetical protein